jgi:hypothetical protein
MVLEFHEASLVPRRDEQHLRHGEFALDVNVLEPA